MRVFMREYTLYRYRQQIEGIKDYFRQTTNYVRYLRKINKIDVRNGQLFFYINIF